MKAKKKGAKTYHHGNLKKALAEVALDLLEKHEEASLTLRELGKRTGVTHAAVYRHFPSKTAILAYLADEGFGKLDALFQERRGLVPIGKAYVEFATTNPGYFKAMFHPSLSHPAHYAHPPKSLETPFGRLVATLDEGLKAGRYHGSSAFVLALMAWSSVHGLSTLLLDRQIAKGRDRERIIDEFLYRVEKGFMAE